MRRIVLALALLTVAILTVWWVGGRDELRTGTAAEPAASELQWPAHESTARSGPDGLSEPARDVERTSVARGGASIESTTLAPLSDVEAPTRPLLVGRVVDSQGLPIAGAQIYAGSRTSPIWDKPELPQGIEPVAFADFEGYFALAPTAKAAELLRVQSPGFAWATALFEPGHETRATALRLTLLASATVIADLGALAPEESAQALVRVSTSAPLSGAETSEFFWRDGGVRWEAAPDASGRARLEGLPPTLLLKIEVHGLAEERVLDHPDVELAPGEERTIRLARGSGAIVEGRLRFEDGRPIVGAELSLLPGATTSFEFEIALEYEKPRSTRSDGSGAFRFDDVADGEWSVGPRPGSDLLLDWHTLRVQDARMQGELELVASVGLFITGRVVTPTGEVAPEASVLARAGSELFFSGCEADDQGRFRVGPLAPGEYRLLVDTSGPTTGWDDPTTPVVPAGTEGVELVAPVLCEIQVRFVDAASGRSLAGFYILSPAGTGDFPIGVTINRIDDDGPTRIDGLREGSYDIVAWNGDRLTALATGVRVGGAKAREITLAARPGAWVRVLGVDVDAHWVYAASAGSLVAFAGETGSGYIPMCVPAGPLTVWRVTTSDPTGPREQRTLEVTASEIPLEVDFDDER